MYIEGIGSVSYDNWRDVENPVVRDELWEKHCTCFEEEDYFPIYVRIEYDTKDLTPEAEFAINRATNKLSCEIVEDNICIAEGEVDVIIYNNLRAVLRKFNLPFIEI